VAGEARLERNVGALDERQAALGREWEALAALASDGRDALGHERQRISDALSDMRARCEQGVAALRLRYSAEVERLLQEDEAAAEEEEREASILYTDPCCESLK